MSASPTEADPRLDVAQWAQVLQRHYEAAVIDGDAEAAFEIRERLPTTGSHAQRKTAEPPEN